MPFTETLTNDQLRRAREKIVRIIEDVGPVSLTKPEIVAAATNLQAFLWANRTAVNAALAEPAKTELTTDQKLALLSIVVVANLEG